MKTIKILVFSIAMGIITIAPAISLAQTKQLECTSGARYELFTAQLDYSSFTPGSGYFVITEAKIVDNYARADLICVGHTLDTVNCMGYMLHSSEGAIQLKLIKKNEDFFVRYKTIAGGFGLKMQNGPWLCNIK